MLVILMHVLYQPGFPAFLLLFSIPSYFLITYIVIVVQSLVIMWWWLLLLFFLSRLVHLLPQWPERGLEPLTQCLRASTTKTRTHGFFVALLEKHNKSVTMKQEQVVQMRFVIELLLLVLYGVMYFSGLVNFICVYTV